MGGTGPAQPYAAPYRAPIDSRLSAVVDPAPAPRSRAVGRTALVVAIGAILIAAVPAWVGAQAAGEAIAYGQLVSDDAGFRWSLLRPARDLILLGEAGVWVGLVLAVWALVQGVVAVRTRRGRGPGIAAAVVSGAFPFVITALAFAGLAVGAMLGAS